MFAGADRGGARCRRAQRGRGDGRPRRTIQPRRMAALLGGGPEPRRRGDRLRGGRATARALGAVHPAALRPHTRAPIRRRSGERAVASPRRPRPAECTRRGETLCGADDPDAGLRRASGRSARSPRPARRPAAPAAAAPPGRRCAARRPPASAAPAARARPAAASCPCRTTASCQPPAPSGAAATSSGDRGQRAQPLPAPQHLHRRPRSDPATGRHSRSGPARPVRRPACTAAASAALSSPSISAAARAGAAGVLRRRRRPADAGHGATSRSGQAGPCSPRCPIRVVQVRTPVNRAISPAVSAASARERNGPIARSCRGSRTTDSRGNGFVGQHHPPPPVRKARPAVVRRGVGGQQPQFAHPGLQRMGAFDVVDRCGEAPPSPSSGRADRRR